MGTAMLYGTVLLLVVLSSTCVNGDMYLHVFALPMGQGDATIIKCPDIGTKPGKLTIIDMGSSSCKVNGCMRKEGITNFIQHHIVEYIFLTHPDIDHYNLISAVVDNVDKDTELYHSCDRSKYKYRGHLPLDDIEPKIKLIEQINKLDCSKGEPSREFSICGGAASIVVLASGLEDACTKSSNNPASLVLQLKYINKKVLFVGDLEREEAVNTVIKCDIKSDALRLAHHGSRENHANSDAFLEKVNADIAIVSSDPLRKMFKHPNSQIIDWYNANKGAVEAHPIAYIRDNDGQVIMEKEYKRAIYSTTVSDTEHKIIDLITDGNSITPKVTSYALDSTQSTLLTLTGIVTSSIGIARGHHQYQPEPVEGPQKKT